MDDGELAMDATGAGIVRRLMMALREGDVAPSLCGQATLRWHRAGNLVVTSGSIVACDPTCIEDDPQPFAARIAPGLYPVVLSIARFPNGNERVAYATLRVDEQDPARWEIASRLGDAPSARDVPCYNVDSGTGCFMDVDALRALLGRAQHDDQDGGAGGDDADVEPGPLELVSEAVYAAHVPTWGCANVALEPETTATVVGFSSGFGDGAYVTYIGYDAGGTPVCFTTDFGLCDEEA